MPAMVMVPRTDHTPGQLRGLVPEHRFRDRRHRLRAIVRVIGGGLSRTGVAAAASVGARTLRDRVMRCSADRLDGLRDSARSGRPPNLEASMSGIKPGSGFFPTFSGFSRFPCPAVPDLSTAFPTGGGVRARRRARRGDPGRPAGDSLSVPDGRGPACRQAAAAVRSSHIRRSRRRALAVTTSLRMTATRATLWGFPLSRSRWYSSLMSGEHLLADSAAI